MDNTRAIILAAGKGTRMKSNLPKAMHEAAGRPMLGWAIEAVRAIDAKPVVVVGYGREAVEEYFKDSVDYALQLEQKGTGHACLMAKAYMPKDGFVLITLADMPLLTPAVAQALCDDAIENGWAGAVLAAVLDDPAGYGRVLRDEAGFAAGIVEHRDCTPEQRKIREVNTSVYCFKSNLLLAALDQIGTDNDQGEYYLTDVIKILSGMGHKIGVSCCSAEEGSGVNDRAQLAEAARILRRRINRAHMAAGVTIIDPENTYIDPDADIGADAVIYPNNVIQKGSRIASGAILYPGNHIVASVIGEGTQVRSSTLIEAKVGADSTIGPNAYLRPGSEIGNHCRIGDFVEVKNSVIGDGSKASHLAYIGDADVGRNVNISCGVVFVNYDGRKKHRTVVEDGAFVGCNTNLVAPVKVGRNAYTAAGSTITKDVPEDALAIARSRQENKEGWSKKK